MSWSMAFVCVLGFVLFVGIMTMAYLAGEAKAYEEYFAFLAEREDKLIERLLGEK